MECIKKEGENPRFLLLALTKVGAFFNALLTFLLKKGKLLTLYDQC